MEIGCHIYLPQEHHKRAGNHSIAVIDRVPDIGEKIVIKPDMLFSNYVKAEPGIYEVTKHFQEYDVADTDNYLDLEKMDIVLVKPLYTIPASNFRNYEFSVEEIIDENGGIEYHGEVVSPLGLIEDV